MISGWRSEPDANQFSGTVPTLQDVVPIEYAAMPSIAP
jgi:hypothetical protein